MSSMVKKVIKRGEEPRERTLEEKVAQQPVSRESIVQHMGNVVSRLAQDAQGEADAILAEAHKAGERLREEAAGILAEVEEAREAARQEGFAEGRAEGLASITEEATRLLDMKERFYESAEPNMISLVMQIVEKVIGTMVEEQSNLIKAVVRQAIEASIGDRINVSVNPEDYKTIKSIEEEFMDLVDRTKRIHFKEDESITRGGCVVETEVGTIDARLETQLHAIKKALEI